MHKHFADWYRIAAIEPHEEFLQRRWAGIEKVLEWLDIDSGIEMIRTSNGAGSTSEFLEQFQGAFKEADSAFPMLSNELELRVLASSCAALVLEGKPSRLSDLVALCIKCASFGNSRMGEGVPDLPARGIGYIEARSREVRAATSKASVQSGLKKIDIEELTRELQAQNFQPLSSAVDAIQGAVSSLGLSVQRALNSILDAQRAQQEELDALWWVVGEYSGDLGRPLSDVKAPALGLVIGKELADKTIFIPGLFAADALIAKALKASRVRRQAKVTLRQAVEESDRTWRTLAAEHFLNDRAERFCPVLLAVGKSLETDDPGSWAPAYEKGNGFDIDRPLDELKLARQVYDELMLQRAAAK